MSQAYYGPLADPKEIELERTFVAGDCVSGVGYGIQLVLFSSCASYLWGRRKAGNRSSMFLLAYMTLLLLVETLFLAVQARTVQDIYVDNRNYPGGPWAYFLATQDKEINVMFYATLFLLTFLADLLIIWRCWVIWRVSGAYAAYAAIALPVLMALGSFALGTLWTLQSSQPGLSLYSDTPRAYGTAYFFLSLFTNIILTGLIVLRLWMHRRQSRGVDLLPQEHLKEYYSISTFVVESAALYSTFAIIFIVTYMVDHPINQIALTVASSSQQISGYWIIYRVARGKAWTQDSLTASHGAKSGIDFAPRGQTTTTDTMGLQSTIDVQSYDRSTTADEKKGQNDSYVSQV
ncbi:hypothetical protein FA15DRAFT_627689 [Coprinopsis marcescibilis]|uniref:G-protein coupled receptors family 1 profile domain-containing protein n=1 Tax=Coprinopsis marcescibilis TaxID=230819 RepID=A0A5C3KF78_COPMA|nr:hypothetical protein FA15DRAFT_627689 [Coprinopsis marcescibilis]